MKFLLQESVCVQLLAAAIEYCSRKQLLGLSINTEKLKYITFNLVARQAPLFYSRLTFRPRYFSTFINIYFRFQ